MFTRILNFFKNLFSPSPLPALDLTSDETPWMRWMESHLGEEEITGGMATPFDVMVFKHTSYGDLNGVMEPGCAATACAALEETGLSSPHNAQAKSFKNYGTQCPLKYGCVVVFQWGDGSNHVTFCHQINDKLGTVVCIGGNQSHKLTYSTYPISRIVATRWPVK